MNNLNDETEIQETEVNENTSESETEITEQTPSYNESILNEEEIADLTTLYNTFNDVIYSIYLTGASCVDYFRADLKNIEIMLILNDVFDTENNRLVKLYIENYLTEHLGTRLHFIFRYLNDSVDPLFHIEGEKLPLREDIYIYHYMTNLDPVCGQKINFNIDLLTLVDADYILYLFSDLVELKRLITLPSGELSYTEPFYPIILSVSFLLNEKYELTMSQLDKAVRAYSNTLRLEGYKQFREDFLNLLRKFDIEF